MIFWHGFTKNKPVMDNFKPRRSCGCYSNRGIIAKQRGGLPRMFNSPFSQETRATFQHNITKMFQYQYYSTYLILIQTA